MKRIILTVSTLLAILLLFTSCGSQKPKNTISNELGIDVSSGEEVSYFDSHGGFHGDGKTYAVLSFSDNKVLEQIEKSTQWKQFPLSETAKTLVYGTSDGTSSIGPLVSDSAGDALAPEIQDGYYLLIDRQTKTGKAAESDVLHRYSFNFTLGLYDVNTNTLYFCKLDT